MNIMSRHDFFNSTSLMILIVLVMGTISIFFGEKIEANNGLGYDGKRYAEIAQNFPQYVLHNQLSPYRIQRILPSAIVHYTLKSLGIPLKYTNIIRGFELYNLTLILITIYVWSLISYELKLGIKGKWLGFLALYINFPLAKLNYYYPVSTDTSAFALGIILLYCFLKDNRIGVLFVTIAGAFTWPTMIYYGIILYLLPRREIMHSPAKSCLDVTLAISSTAIVLSGIVYFYFIKHSDILSSVVPLVDKAVYLSIAVVILYVFFSLRPIFDYDQLYNPKHLTKINTKRLIVISVAFVSIRMLQYFLAGPGGGGHLKILELTCMLPIQRPFIFYLSHVIYYGPIILLTCLLWNRICRIIHQFGIGLTLFVLMNIMLSLNSESRFLIPFFPFVVALTVKSTEELRWKSSYYWSFAILCFLYSKVWLGINAGNAGPSKILYFMNFGPWMSNVMFITQGCFVFLTVAIIYFFAKKLFPQNS